MQTSAPTWRQLVLPVGFLLACVVIAIVIWRAFGGTVPGEADGYRVSVDLPQADALFSNTSVRSAGVEVGHVVAVKRIGSRARVELQIDGKYAPIRTDAKVKARTKTLLGEAYVELTQGRLGTRAAAIPDGGRIAASNVEPVQRLDDVLQTFEPRTRREFQRLMAGMSDAFAGRAADVNDSIGRARTLSTDVRVLSASLQQQRPQIQQLLGGSADVLDALSRRSGSIERAITASDRLLSVTDERSAALKRTIAALPPFLERLQGASDNISRAAPDLNRAVASLRPTVPLLQPAMESLSRDTPVFRNVLRGLPKVIRTGDRALPAAERILDTAGPNLAPTYDSLREVIPVVQLMADSRNSIVGAFANVAAMTNGRAEYPGGKEFGYVSAVLTVWNEVVGGWTKKLPTNRQNPYPAPDSAARIATGGLEAYDCRNVNNPSLLPAIGTGSPDCKTQAPWTFQGRTAAYPRLYLAKP